MGEIGTNRCFEPPKNFFKKSKKIFKNLLTKRFDCGIIIKLLRKTVTAWKPQEKLKNFEKNFKNLLTNGFKSDIIVERSHEARAKLNLDN